MAVLNMKLLLALSLLSVCISSVNGGNILLFPFGHGSHVNFFAVLGKALQDAGHDVSVFVTPAFAKLATKQNLKTILAPEMPGTRAIFDRMSSGVAEGNPFNIWYEMSTFVTNQTRIIFNDKEYLPILKAAKFDLVIIDGIPFGRSNYIVPYALEVPYLTLTAFHDPWSSGLPTNAALEGVQINVLHGDTTIFERIKNLAMALGMLLPSPNGLYSYATDDLFSELVPDKPNIGYAKAYKNSEMFLMNLDRICLDFHRTSAPHYQFLSMLGSSDAKPLPKDIEEFVSASKHGFILMTLGSGLKRVPEDVLIKVLKALGGLKQNVMIRHEGDVPGTVPANIRITNWIPQNDILGHPNTKLFISHGGNNGQQEAVYHGVPMLIVPFFGDQFYNSKRIQLHKYGLGIDPKDFSVDELKAKVDDLLNNRVYSESIQNCSRILRSLPSGEETAVYWIEHVLKFGGKHLKPYYMDMPLYKYFMLDIFCLILVVLFIVFKVIKLVFKCFCKVCCSRNEKAKRE